MADLGPVETKFFDGLKASCLAKAKLAEDYLKNSDTASRPAGAVRLAAAALEDSIEDVEKVDEMIKYIQDGGSASEEAAQRLMGRYNY